MKKFTLVWGVLVFGSVVMAAAAIHRRVVRTIAGFPAAHAIRSNISGAAGDSNPGPGPAVETTVPPEVPRLSPFEEEVVMHPFASKTARLRMRRRLDSESDTDDVDLKDRGDMGWALPDRKYWKTIPAEARLLPSNLPSLPVVTFTNTEIDGVRRIWLHQGPKWDQWVLRDAEHDVWACISVEQATRRVYFREMSPLKNGGWRLRPGQDNCYSCHPSGPRVIRPFATDTVAESTLGAFNRRILSYGACHFGDSVDLRLRGKPLADMRCVGCHNGVQRGRLYGIHKHVAHFKTQWEQSMPPKKSLL